MTTPLISTTLPAVPCACSDMTLLGKDFLRKCDARRRKRARSLAERPFRQVGCRTSRTACRATRARSDSPSRRRSRSVCSSASATSAGCGSRGARGPLRVVHVRRPGGDPERHRRHRRDRRDRAEAGSGRAPRRRRGQDGQPAPGTLGGGGPQLRRDRRDVVGEGAAGGAVREMGVEQPALEHRQLTVRRQRRPGACSLATALSRRPVHSSRAFESTAAPSARSTIPGDGSSRVSTPPRSLDGDTWV